MKNLLIKHIPFLILAPFLCYFSGVFFPEMGIRAAILGFSIAAGVTAANILNSTSLENSAPYSKTSIIRNGLLFGLIAGILISFVPLESFIQKYEDRIRSDGFLIIPNAFAYSLPSDIITAVSYNILILLGYSFHFSSKIAAFFLVFIAANISVLTIAIFPSPTPTHFNIVGGMIMGACPFAILWFIAAAIADPAFSYKRWKKRTR